VARIHQFLNPSTPLRRTLHRRQQVNEHSPVPGPGVFFEGPAERLVLHASAIRDPRRVRRQECKRILRIPFVLRQMKTNPTHTVPQRTSSSEPFAQTARLGGDLAPHREVQLFPERRQRIDAQILSPVHGRG